MLTKDQLLTAQLPIEKVALPELGDDSHVYVRTLSAAERDDWEAEQLELRPAEDDEKSVDTQLKNIRARLCIRCLCDADGKPVLGSADAEAFGKQSARVLQRIFNVAMRLSGFNDKDLRELAKNS